MNDKIKAHLTAYCQRNGWDTTDAELLEVVTEAKPIHREITNSHRWYDDTVVVVKVDGMLLQYNGYHTTGGTSISDMDLKYDLNSVIEVEKKQKTVDYYAPVD